MREILIDERDFTGPRDFMAWVKQTLSLPEWTGNGLPALHDVLTDICEPTRITIVRRDPTPDTWFDKATMAIIRATMENDRLTARIK
jgi:RNAse (barnase) inhibitor barstar